MNLAGTTSWLVPDGVTPGMGAGNSRVLAASNSGNANSWSAALSFETTCQPENKPARGRAPVYSNRAYVAFGVSTGVACNWDGGRYSLRGAQGRGPISNG